MPSAPSRVVTGASAGLILRTPWPLRWRGNGSATPSAPERSRPWHSLDVGTRRLRRCSRPALPRRGPLQPRRISRRPFAIACRGQAKGIASEEATGPALASVLRSARDESQSRSPSLWVVMRERCVGRSGWSRSLSNQCFTPDHQAALKVTGTAASDRLLARAAQHHQIGDQDLYGVAVLVQRGRANFDQALVRA